VKATFRIVFDLGKDASKFNGAGVKKKLESALRNVLWPKQIFCDEPYTEESARRRARILELAEELASEGDLEVDEDAVVSEGDDNGAYVQMWKWVDFGGTEMDKEP